MRWFWVASGKLSRPQLEDVLRRAAELEAGRSNAAAAEEAASEHLGEQDVVRLGVEAGLSETSLRRALGEMRRGELTVREESALGLTLGPGQILVSREVPGPAEPIQRAVDRFLREQLMTVRRHHGERIEWERARGLWPGLARSLDFARRYAFGPVTRVETVVTAEAADATSVTFRIDVSEMRRHRFTRALLRAGAAFTIFGIGGAALFPGFGMNDVLALLGGGAAAGGLFALERRRFEESRALVALAPEKFLDLLVLRRRRALGVASSSVGDDL
jgi:hypothetical protein